MANIIETAETLQEALDRRNSAALTRVINEFQVLHGALEDKIDLLLDEIAKLETPTSGQIRRGERYRELLAQIDDRMQIYGGRLAGDLEEIARTEITSGAAAAEQLVRAGGVEIQWNRLPEGALRRLIGFLDPMGPLLVRLNELSGGAGEYIGRAILEGVALGKGPRELARIISSRFSILLNDSLRLARTVQLYSYREANRESFKANSNVVTGWVWYAHLDDLVCMSCVVMHGTTHSNDESLDDHWNGRCVMLPMVWGNQPIGEKGEAWFKQQDEETQRKMLGSGRYFSWKNHEFELADISKQVDDPILGTMRVERSWKELTQ